MDRGAGEYVGNRIRVSICAAALAAVALPLFAPPARTSASQTAPLVERPLADAYVQAGPHASTNFGAAPSLIVKLSSDAQWQREAYLRFNIGSIQSGQSVMLRLHGGLSDTRQSSVTAAIHAVASTSWAEGAITWNTRPAAAASPLATFSVSGTTARWYEVDLTSHVQAQRSAGQTQLSLALRGVADTLPYAGFGSREGSNGPELVAWTGTALPAVTLVRGPYLQQTTDASATVVWATREPGPAWTTFWTPTDPERSAPAQTFFYGAATTGLEDYYQHEATLTGLRPGTTYSYDLRVNGADPTPGVVDRFRTAPPRGTGSLRFVAFADSGAGTSAQARIAQRLAAETFDAALHAGDIVYSNGTFAEFDARFFPYYGSWLRKRAFFPSIGNHDDRTAFAAPYRALFVLPENGYSSLFPDHAERYYSFDYGPVHIVVLDTEQAFQSASRRQEQLAWLDADLQGAQGQPWRIALFHRTPFSAGSRHGSDLAVRQAFRPLFEKHGVQLVIAAHEHNYERTVPWRDNPDAPGQAVTYLVTGGGGANLYPVGQAAWTAVARSVHHYVRGIFSTSQLTIEAVDADGRIFDRFTLDRHLQHADAAAPAVSIVSPPPGAVLKGVESIHASATDDVRVEKVDLWVDGILKAISLAAPYTFSLDTRTLADGDRTLEVRAYDIAGRRASARHVVRVMNASSPGEVVLYAAEAGVRQGRWRVVSDPAAASGHRMESPFTGEPRVDPPLAHPADYFEMRFAVEQGRPYRLWMRGKAHGDSGYRDSVWAQFSGSVSASGVPVYRIGSSSAAWLNLEACRSCGVKGWGWQDNGFAELGPEIYFASTGVETVRIQVRENGLSLDQLVLSPSAFLWSSPGAAKLDATILPREGGLDAADPVLADAYVRAGAHASTSFGSASELVVKESATADNRREAYLRLDISTVQPGDIVSLRLLGWLSDTRNPSVRTNLYACEDLSWAESTLTWNTRPPRSSAVLGSVLVTGTSPAWHSVDLTAHVQAKRSAGGTSLTLVLASPEATSPYAAFAARESGTGPQLLITR